MPPLYQQNYKFPCAEGTGSMLVIYTYIIKDTNYHSIKFNQKESEERLRNFDSYVKVNFKPLDKVEITLYYIHLRKLTIAETSIITIVVDIGCKRKLQSAKKTVYRYCYDLNESGDRSGIKLIKLEITMAKIQVC
ncbi:hypothetical protein Glove_23g81 [Diversispora epigaea]|uniref:Uncharacterized protein n=1 Tax=Diversispora epigaea TaxID=1348612 RepID=A0A397JNA3_9GLOM|nr:hypothetical protein Glove_23g81 [Diversispora epigaea]